MIRINMTMRHRARSIEPGQAQFANIDYMNETSIIPRTICYTTTVNVREPRFFLVLVDWKYLSVADSLKITAIFFFTRRRRRRRRRGVLDFPLEFQMKLFVISSFLFRRLNAKSWK